MINELGTRTQLAIAIKSSEQVYINWLCNRKGGDGFVYSDKNYSFHLNAGSLLLVIWRESGKHPLASLDIMPKGKLIGDLVLFVENYFRGAARDKLSLYNSDATFEDYLKLANNFPEKAVESMLMGLLEGFEHCGLADEYNYQLSCVK
jgi:hypothetical protein